MGCKRTAPPRPQPKETPACINEIALIGTAVPQRLITQLPLSGANEFALDSGPGLPASATDKRLHWQLKIAMA